MVRLEKQHPGALALQEAAAPLESLDELSAAHTPTINASDEKTIDQMHIKMVLNHI